MDQGKIIAFRVAGTLHKNLLQMAETQGCTLSDVARNIITEHMRSEDILRELQEMKKSLSHEIAQVRGVLVRGGSTGNGDIDEVKRIVTLIGMAMPSVARRI